MKAGVKMKKTVRLSDIAERLQVSTVTVSNALAGQKGVSTTCVSYFAKIVEREVDA